MKTVEYRVGALPPAFKLRHAAKDLRLVAEEAAIVDHDVKVAIASRAWLDSAVEGGAADLDFSAVVAAIAGEKPQP